MKSILNTCIGLFHNQEFISFINEFKIHIVKLVYDEIYIYIWIICIYSILLFIIILSILILLFKQIRILNIIHSEELLIAHI